MSEKTAGWRVSSYTGSQGNCVEVGQARDAVVVRDTKARDVGSLRLPAAAWRDFVESLNR